MLACAITICRGLAFIPSDVYTNSSVGLLIQPLPVNTLLSCPNFGESFCITSQWFQICSNCSRLALPFLKLAIQFRFSDFVTLRHFMASSVCRRAATKLLTYYIVLWLTGEHNRIQNVHMCIHRISIRHNVSPAIVNVHYSIPQYANSQHRIRLIHRPNGLIRHAVYSSSS